MPQSSHSNMRFSMRDRNSLIILVIVVLASAVLIPYMGGGDSGNSATTSSSSDSSRTGKRWQYAQPDQGYGDGSAASTPHGELFPFDPNTADSTTLLRLGLQPWQVRSIYKYRAHGGRFRTPDDFAQLYGLTLEHYQRLKPYIRIKQEVMARDVIKPSRGQGVSPSPADGEQRKPAYPVQDKIAYGTYIDINTADTTQLKRIPGIGSYFARRIVELRQRRQAFTSPEELLVIKNFPETALGYMKASANFPAIHINTMTQKQLQEHPLINYLQARDIIALRRTAGSVKTAGDLSMLKSFSSEQLKRITPYLVFD